MTISKAINPSQQKERPFHMTIGVGTTKALNIQNDLRLLRTALLYGDKVKLCSYTTSFLYSMFRYATSLEGLLEFMEISAQIVTDETRRERELAKVAYHRHLLRKKRRDRQELIDLSKFKTHANEFQNGLRQDYPPITQEEEFRGIKKAIDAGILELHNYERLSLQTIIAEYHLGRTNPNQSGISPSSEAFYEEFIQVLSETLQSRTTYPLFDDTAGTLAMNSINPEGTTSISEVRIAQAKHSATAANMLERLPDFGLTPVDSILDIRKELHPYLDPFRSGIKTYSTKIKSAPWNKDFAPEADEVFISEVKPAFLALEQSIKTNRSIVKEMKDAKSIIGYVTGAGGSVLSCFVSDFASLPLYARIVFGLTTGMITPLVQWALNQIQPKPEIKGHTLYFYYKLRDKVERT